MRQAFALRRFTIPAGSSLSLNGDTYLDPRRDDRLNGAVLGAAATLPAGLEAPSGARVWFSHVGNVVSVRGDLGPVSPESFPIDATRGIDWDDDGSLKSFHTSRDVSLGGFTVPAGSGRILHFWLPGTQRSGAEVFVPGPVPVFPDGTVDRARPRRNGHLRPAEP